MNVGKCCSRIVYTAKASEPLASAVEKMGTQHVGAAVVIDPGAPWPRPVGILTDRDAVCAQIIHGKDLFHLSVGDAMTAEPLTLSEDIDITAAIRCLSAHKVRRAPVVSEAGDLVGIVSLDDLLPVVAEELNALAQLLGSQARHEQDEAALSTPR